MYEDKEELKLKKKIYLTNKVHGLLKKEKKRLRKEEGRRVSMAKIVCNLILKELENKKF